MRFSLRTLMIVLALGPPLLALWWRDANLAVLACLLASVIVTIAYWPLICGKGG